MYSLVCKSCYSSKRNESQHVNLNVYCWTGMTRIALYLAIPVLLAAQPPVRQRSTPAPQNQAPAVRPEDYCSVEGQVFNGSTGEPRGKAALTLRRVDAPQGAPGGARALSASSNSSGKLSIVNTEPGK